MSLIATPTSGGPTYQTGYAQLTAPGQTDWVKFSDTGIIAQVDGPATAATVILERMSVPPGTYGAAAAPVDATNLSGNPSTGIASCFYTESGVAWWRLRATAVTGQVNLSLTGRAG